MIKQVKGHSCYYACDRCEVKGERVFNHTVFPDKAEERTDESFRIQRNEEHHIGDSILTKLKIDMINAFPIDYMHNVCLGVMKRMLTI